MDVPQEETLELPGGRKQAPTLQGFFLVWWLVMVLVQKTGNPKSSVLFKESTTFLGGDSLWCFFSREPDLNKTSTQKSSFREVSRKKSCPKSAKLWRGASGCIETRCGWIFGGATNFEQRKGLSGCLGLYRGCKTTHLCVNYSKPL